jgi:cobaltochelatase CobS
MAALKPVRYAGYDSKSCPRCKQPVRKGSPVEEYRIPGEAFTRIAHLGCTAPGAKDAEDESTPPPPPRPRVEENGRDQGSISRYELRSVVANVVNEVTDGMETRVADLVKQRLVEPLTGLINQGVARAAEAFLAKMQPKEILVKRPDGSECKLDGEVTHERFEDVLEMIAWRQDMFLPGPTGSGKTFLVAQAARAAGVPFGMISCSKGMSEGMLNGRLIPRGAQGQFEFLGTMLLHVYENGGVFLFDEMDAADANALLVINSALANGVMAVPNRHELPDGVTTEEYMKALEGYDFRNAKGPFQYRGYGPYATRHPDFVAAAAANTYGTGADRMYVGRDPLDLSTRDRFLLGTIDVDYSERVEAALCPDPELLATLHEWRRRIRAADLQRVVSTRFVRDAYVARKRGWPITKIASRFFAGWSLDEVVTTYGRQPDWSGG